MTSAFGSAPNIGAALRAVRELRGYSLDELAEATRIRRSYLAALEDMRLDQLPSRPFTIGYVRAVAQVLGLDQDAVVRRFKADDPDPSEPLRAPIGVSRERDPRLTLAAGAAAIVLCAVLVWNLAQHAVAKDAQPVPAVPETAASAAVAPKGAIVLSAALPAPPETQAPTPYVTPGLTDAQTADGAPLAAELLPLAPPAPVAPMRPDPRALTYGAAASQSTVTFRARKAASLIIRGADGSVYFARQLATGESYRAPMLGGLTVDVSDPAAFDIYAYGAFKGQLLAPQTPLSKLTS